MTECLLATIAMYLVILSPCEGYLGNRLFFQPCKIPIHWTGLDTRFIV